MNDRQTQIQLTSDSLQGLDEVVSYYDQGQYIRAYHIGTEHLGPIESWPGVRGRILAGRVAYNLGAPRWAQAWHLRVCREFPDDPESIYYQHSSMIGRRGAIAVWRSLTQSPFPEYLTDRQRAELLGLRAHVFAILRDFSSAQADLQEALRLAPDHVWILVDQHAVLAAMDRREEALESTARALETRPYYRPAVQSHAYQLVQLNRDDEAESLLRRGAEYNQSGDLWSQLVALYYETERYAEAEECLRRAEANYILRDRDKGLKKWLAGRNSDLAYRRGDYAEAIRLAEQVDTPFFKSLTQSMREALEQPEREYRRVLLNVHFVRQHHMTCAPATLTALAGYWNHPVDHVELAQSICYDGTPGHEERNWADTNGFATREFRVTWDNARALIDQGIPLTLTTIGPQTGHLQPIIGYDERRGVLLVRDPGERHHVEYRAQELLDHFSSSGPRGMAMVPCEEAARLKGINLEGAEFYDLVYALQRALDVHDRAAAAARLADLQKLDATHRLTLHAEAMLAWYDQDRMRQLQAVEPLAARFPKDVNQQLARLSLLGELGRKSAWMQQLRELCEGKETDPIYWRMLASRLIEDDRSLTEGGYWIRRLLKRRQSGDDLNILSRFYWRRDERELAVQIMRLAVLAESRNESLSAEYFTMARACGQTEQALEFLRERHLELGPKSAGPTYTLAWALDLCDRHEAADRALMEGLDWRPNDGDALINADQFRMGWGRVDEARELLRQAEPISNRARWLNTSARMAMIFDDLETQESLNREALALHPLNLASVRALYTAIGDRQGTDAALEFLESYVGQYPEHYDLRQLWIVELRRESRMDRWLPELERMLELHPDDPWALREMALVLLDSHQGERALPYAERAREIEPTAPASWSVMGQVLGKLGRRDEAVEAYKSSLQESIDWEPAFELWMEMCESREDRLQVLEVVRRELKTQVVNGDLLLTLLDHVQPTLDDQQALALFSEMEQERPDLFQTGLACLEMFRRRGEWESARELMEKVTSRFALIPRVWLDAASVAKEMGDQELHIEYLRRALAINPRWPQTIYRLSMALQAAGCEAEAIERLQKSQAEMPREPVVRCALAEIYWQQKRSDEAVQAMTEVVSLRHDFGYAWDCLREWVQKLERPELVIEAARGLTQQRPKEIHSWTLLVDVLPHTGETWQERHDALEQALAINPLATDVLHRKAYLFAEIGEFDQAIATCQTLIHGRPTRALQVCELDLLADYRSLQAAIERLKSMLTDDPDSASLWHRLADWSERTGDWPEYHRAVEQMVRTAPGNAVCWGYRGDSLLRQEQKVEATRCFEKAIQLDPKYEFGVGQLLDLYLEDGRLDDTERMLQRVARYISNGIWLLGQMRLALARDQRDQALKIFGQLLEDRDALLGVKRQAISEMEPRGLLPQASQVMSQMMAVDDHAEVGQLWAWGAISAGTAAVAEAFDHLANASPANAAWHEACQSLLINVATHEDSRGGHQLIKSRLADITSEDASWAAAAEYVLDSAGGDKARYRWLRNWITPWREHTQLSNYQWFQLIRVASSLEDWDTVLEMAGSALGDPRLQTDENSELTRLWFTLALMQRGEWGEVQRQIGLFRDFGTIDYYEALRRYLRAVEHTAHQFTHIGPTASRERRKGLLKSLQKALKADAEIQSIGRSPMLRRAMQRVEDQVRTLAGFPVTIWTRILRVLTAKW